MSVSSVTASYPYDYASMMASEAAAVLSGAGAQSSAVSASDPVASETAALLAQLGAASNTSESGATQAATSSQGGVDMYV